MTDVTGSSRSDYRDPTFVLGAVLAQLEDLPPADQRAVLLSALSAITTCPDHFVGAEHLRCEACGFDAAIGYGGGAS